MAVPGDSGTPARLQVGRRPTELLRPLAGAVGAAAVAAAGALKVAGWTWPAAIRVLAVLAAAAGVLEALHRLVEPVRARRTAERDAVERVEAVLVPGTRGRIDQVDPLALGVAESVTGASGPYIERSIDEKLQNAVSDGAANGGLVVVSGHPKAGKSRTLLHALTVHPDVASRAVIALRAPYQESEATERPLATLLAIELEVDGPQTVLWIDDAHDHFAHGLTGRALAQLRDRHAGLLVAMTVHSERLHVSEHSSPSDVDRYLVRELTNVALELPATLSADEQAEACRLYPGLAGSTAAQVDVERLPAWLAGVPYLQQRYRANQHGNPGGVAVAKAAIDWRRAGMPVGMSTDQLRALSEAEYDELTGGDGFTDDTYAAALRWAKGEHEAPLRQSGIALVRPIRHSHGTLWRDFDAVTAWAVDHDPPVPKSCWEYIVTQTTPETAYATGVAAHRAGELTTAERAYRKAVVGDNAPSALLGLGMVLQNLGRAREAEDVYHDAIASGHPEAAPIALLNLGNLCRDLERLDDAERAWRRAIATGHEHAAPIAGVCLAILLQLGGRVDEADPLLHQAIASNHPKSALAARKVLEIGRQIRAAPDETVG